MPKWDRYPHALPSEDINNGWHYPDGKTEKEHWEEYDRLKGIRDYNAGPSSTRGYKKEEDWRWGWDSETREWKRLAPFQNYDPITRIIHFYGYRTWNVGDGRPYEKLSPEKDGVTWSKKIEKI